MRSYSLLMAFFLLSHLSSGFAQSSAAEGEIKAIMEKFEAAGLAVAVVKKGKIIYSQSFGYKDLESREALDQDDIFRIASISKSFTVSSLLQLVEVGKVSLDDDFGDLVGFKIRNPKYPDTKITLKMVLSHTSSINDSQGYFSLDAINPAKNPDYAKCYNDYAPGEGYQYCNLNFNMAGAVLEKYSGERFDHYVQNHVLAPLDLYGGYNVNELDSTKFVNLYEYDSASKSLKYSPTAYANRKQEIAAYQMTYTTPIFSPTGGMKISAKDLAKYMIMHMNYGKANGKRIISKKNAKLMQKAVDVKADYGLALAGSDKLIDGKYLKGHTGSAYGLFSAMFFDPKEKYGFVVICSGSKGGYKNGFYEVNYAVINSLYQHLIKNKYE